VRIVLDTNVLVSAVFFGGVPGRILEAWRDGRLQLVLSAAILDEYQRVGQAISAQCGGVDLEPILALLTVESEIIEAPALPAPISSDSEDDKFFACASAAGASVIVSGDKHLLDHDGWRGVRVLRPRRFVDEFLSDK
jgi:putative PIN family toxin of toxin-antitoxin system